MPGSPTIVISSGVRVADDAREGRAQAADLLLAADERAVEPAPDRRSIGVDVPEQEAAVGELGCARGVAHQAPGRFVHPDLTARRPTCASRSAAPTASPITGAAADPAGRDDLAGADAAAGVQAERQPLRPGDELGGRTQRALRVVLVRDRRAEGGQDGVTAQLGDDAAVARADRAAVSW